MSVMLFRSIAALVTSLLFSSVTWACLNDVDTMRIEEEGRFEVREMVAGRFEINPRLYYQVRVDRILAKIKEGSAVVTDYDDLSVPYERMGLTDAAIKAIKEKRPLLKGTDTEDHYRFHANLGTFCAHKALRERELNKELLKKALKELEEAVRINPDAHFGREEAQIGLIRALAEGRDKPENYVNPDPEVNAYFGLIVMGAARESPDVWFLASKHTGMTEVDRLLIHKRIHELNRAFRFPELEKEFYAESRIPTYIDVGYGHLKENGTEYQTYRTEWMIEKLEKLQHPDDGPEFWEGYDPIPPVNWRLVQPTWTQKNPELAFLFWLWVTLVLGRAVLRVVKMLHTRRPYRGA